MYVKIYPNSTLSGLSLKYYKNVRYFLISLSSPTNTRWENKKMKKPQRIRR